ncbi:hypothetical protein Ga0074812_102417 [Parafrankia irregularis]|uniref:Uncharacterized protein n=1 Tax=Parafrankia irregularis TaxID=795642 RepID=A0A0S4QG72_9ACTN|nr:MULTISPECIES: hypothetical protein [Parafrankia]MBE3202963.1 hypothetical protein [Parafrankia sp. CH37]CUU54407.1 hypothetical protein Ga0074812_102417 [Parafrankia irregularis]
MTRAITVIVRRDGESWSAWSPQCPGLAVAEPTAAELRAALPEAFTWYFDGDPDFEILVHLEQELRGVVVRIAQDAFGWERQLVAERLGAALGVQEQAERLRAAPPNSAGEVVYVCALPSDSISWLTAQLDDVADPVVVALPAEESTLWTLQFGGGRRTGVGTADVGYSSDTTLGEVMMTFTGPGLRLSA